MHIKLSAFMRTHGIFYLFALFSLHRDKSAPGMLMIRALATVGSLHQTAAGEGITSNCCNVSPQMWKSFLLSKDVFPRLGLIRSTCARVRRRRRANETSIITIMHELSTIRGRRDRAEERSTQHKVDNELV